MLWVHVGSTWSYQLSNDIYFYTTPKNHKKLQNMKQKRLSKEKFITDVNKLFIMKHNTKIKMISHTGISQRSLYPQLLSKI